MIDVFKSSVAGIFGPDGRLRRVVVSKNWQIVFHLEKDENYKFVPGLKVSEPVGHEAVPGLLRRVEEYFQ